MGPVRHQRPSLAQTGLCITWVVPLNRISRAMARLARACHNTGGQALNFAQRGAPQHHEVEFGLTHKNKFSYTPTSKNDFSKLQDLALGG